MYEYCYSNLGAIYAKGLLFGSSRNVPPHDNPNNVTTLITAGKETTNSHAIR